MRNKYMETATNNWEEKLKRSIEELLAKMGFDCEVEIKKVQEEKEVLICNIKTDQSSFLIGQYGVNLESLQHIVRVISRKNLPERSNFILDVNSYRQEKNESIAKMARDYANEALLERRAVVLRPMSPYERRLVHMELSKNDKIKTESIGEGENRRVVIKPLDLI